MRVPSVIATWIMPAAAGLAAGGIYFAGLWWTVRRLNTSRRPTALTLASFALRAALVLVVFYLVAQGHWERFLGLMAGFVLARAAITRRLRPRAPEHRPAGADRAPATETTPETDG
jgi:F1F0 ATPase subunit 2